MGKTSDRYQLKENLGRTMKTSNPRMTLLGICAMSLSAMSCGKINKISERQYSLDGVKRITPSITDSMDSSTFQQDEYMISNVNRLLIRYEKLNKGEANIVADSTHPVEIQVRVLNSEDPNLAKTHLKL